jgi:hypothetical protein
MEIEYYNYLCSLIIDCAAYAIGGAAIHERIIMQICLSCSNFIRNRHGRQIGRVFL